MSFDPIETRELNHQIAMGVEAETFLGSHLGRYVIERAEAERDAALDALKCVSPVNAEGIRELQAKVWRAEAVQFWLAELITEGRNALEQLAERERAD